MKKLILISALAFSLCGCSYWQGNTSQHLNIYAAATFKDCEAYTGIFKNITSEYGSKAAKDELKKLPLSDAKLIQKDMPVEKVNVYKNNTYDILIAGDGTNYAVYNTSYSPLEPFASLVSDYRAKGWHFTNSITGGDVSKLDFANDEYILANDSYSYFSLDYDNVTLYSENIPLSISLYTKNNATEKLYIKYIDLPYGTNTLSNDNINMLTDALNIAGIANGDIFINKLQGLINGSNENTELSGYSIKTLTNIPIQIKDYTQSVMIIGPK